MEGNKNTAKCQQRFEEENHKLSTKLKNMEKESRDVAELKKQLERFEKDQKSLRENNDINILTLFNNKYFKLDCLK